MRHPTKKQMQKVIDRLKTILPMARKAESLCMVEGSVASNFHTCGTVHCFGGWYAVACRNRKPIKQKIAGLDCHFSDGANLMAKDLGFISHQYLEDWAESNPKIWGNKEGGYMFLMRTAFSERSVAKEARNVKDIVKHLQRVCRRLPK